MLCRLGFVMSSVLLLTSISLGQPGPPSQQADADPIARLTDTLEELKAQNRKVVTRMESSSRVVYERRIVRYGVFGRKCRVVIVRRVVTTSTPVSEIREGLDGGIGWNNPGETVPSLPELVIATGTPKAVINPNSAGLRASRVRDYALSYLTNTLKVPSDQLDSKLDSRTSLNKDVYLAIVQREFVPNPNDPKKERSFRVFATVDAVTLNVVELVVQVQQRLVGLDNEQKGNPQFYDSGPVLQGVADDFLAYLSKQAT
jgi:hypothetical protein